MAMSAPDSFNVFTPLIDSTGIRYQSTPTSDNFYIKFIDRQNDGGVEIIVTEKVSGGQTVIRETLRYEEFAKFAKLTALVAEFVQMRE